MNPSRRFSMLSVVVFLGLLAAVPAQAAGGGGGGTYLPIMEAGVNFHSGDTGKSLSGSQQYILIIRSEAKKGMFRPSVSMDLGYSRGTTTIGTDELAFTLMGVGFVGGVNLFPFTTGRFQPFVGGHGILAWNLMRLTTPPTGVEPNSQGLAFGYEIAAGADLRFGNVEGRAFRVHGGFWNATSTLAGVTGFQLNGFRLTLGLIY